MAKTRSYFLVFAISILSCISIGHGDLVIIDTDAGADDAAAILLMASAKQHKILAITCLNGNAHLNNVVPNVYRTLQAAERLDIPVYRGASNSILDTPKTDNFFGMDGFGDYYTNNISDYKSLLQEEHAVNALIRLASEYKGQVSILALGPLTNVALAIRLDPSFLQKIKKIVILGGSTEGVGNVRPDVEFNFYMDPHAAYIVLNTINLNNGTVKPITLVPWELIFVKTSISMAWRKTQLGVKKNSRVELLNNSDRKQLNGNNTKWICGDCYAAAVMYDPSIALETTSHYAYVDVDGPLSKGAIYVDYTDLMGKLPNVNIVMQFDIKHYKNIMLQI